MSDRMLLAVASTIETDAVLGGGGTTPDVWEIGVFPAFDLVVTGVGKANAAGAVARHLDPSRHGLVLSVGFAGSLPGSQLEIGDLVIAESCVFADEGIATPDGFSDIASIGFPPIGEGCSISCDPDTTWKALHVDADRVGIIATVSTCSGTDRAASEIADRTGACAEAMEGAGVALAARRLGVTPGEVRVISNTTGDRTTQRWDIALACERLGELFGPR